MDEAAQGGRTDRAGLVGAAVDPQIILIAPDLAGHVAEILERRAAVFDAAAQRGLDRFGQALPRRGCQATGRQQGVKTGVEAGLERVYVADPSDGTLVEQGISERALASAERPLEILATKASSERFGTERRDRVATIDVRDEPRPKPTKAPRIHKAQLPSVAKLDDQVSVDDPRLLGARDPATARHAQVDQQDPLALVGAVHVPQQIFSPSTDPARARAAQAIELLVVPTPVLADAQGELRAPDLVDRRADTGSDETSTNRLDFRKLRHWL